MRCNQCGKENLDGAKFCAGCGAALNVVEPGNGGTEVLSQPEVQPVAQSDVQQSAAQPEQQPQWQGEQTDSQPRRGEVPVYHSENNYSGYSNATSTPNYGQNMKPNGNGTVCMVLGIVSVSVGFFSCFFSPFSVAAIVCGIIALVMCKKDENMGVELIGNHKAGRVCAIVGIVLGGIAVFIAMLWCMGVSSLSHSLYRL